MVIIAAGVSLLAPAVARGADAQPGSNRNVVADGTFETGSILWQPVAAGSLTRSTAAHGGHGALEIRALAHADAGAYTLLNTGSQPGLRFSASAWVRAARTSAGKWFRLQLNETGGAAPPTTLGGDAVARVRLTPAWQHVEITGRVRSAGRTNVTLIAVVEKAARNATFLVDDVRARALRSHLGAPLLRFSRRIAPVGAPITVATPGGRVFLRAFGKRPDAVDVLLVPAPLIGSVATAADPRLIRLATISLNRRGYGVAQFSVPPEAVGSYGTLLHCRTCSSRSDAGGLLDAGPYPTGFQIVPPAPTPTQTKPLAFGALSAALVAILAVFLTRPALARRRRLAGGAVVNGRPWRARAPLASARARTWAADIARRRLVPDALTAIGGILLALLVLTAVLRLHALPGFACPSTCANMHVPLAYAGAYSSDDSEFFHMVVKSIVDHGWYQHNPNLGAPAGQQLYDFPLEGDNLQYALIKVLAVFSSSSALVMNLYFILTFPLTVLSAFLVLRLLGLTRLTSFVFSIVYTFAPYHLLRGETHLPLAGYYAVPLAVYLVLSACLGRPLFARGRRNLPGLLQFTSPRTFGTIAMCLVIGSTGIYYAVFTLLLLAAAALAALARPRGWAGAVAALVACGLIAATVVVNLLPSVVYRHSHGTNAAATQRTPQDTEWFSLRLADLVLPVDNHRIPFLAHVKRHYTQSVATPQSQGEASYEPLGVVGAIGFVWLLFVALAAVAAPGRRRRVRDIHAYSAFAVLVAILVATTGGVSTIVAYYFTAQIRGWNRISIVIGFFALVALALLVDGLRSRWRSRGRARLAAFALVALLAVAIFDQTTSAMIPPYGYISGLWHSDDAFVHRIEHRLPPNAAVFQFPYVPFVWTGTNKILSYDPARGYLHSKTLRWSWGAMRGRPEQDWQPYLYDTPLPTLLPEILAAGFDGIWVDRNGYTDSGRALERSLRSLVHVRPIVSRDKRFVFFDLTSYARALRAAHPAADVRQLRRSTLEPLRLSPEQGYAPQLAPQISLGPAAGFDALEQVTLPETNALLIAGPRLVTWRWTTQPTATLTLTNPSTAARSVQLRAVLQSAGDKPAKLDVQFPDGSVQHLTVTSKGVALRRTLLLKAGSSTVILSDHGPPYVERETTRSVYLRVAADVTDSSVGRYGSPPPLYGCASALPTHDCKPRPFEDFATPPAG